MKTKFALHLLFLLFSLAQDGIAQKIDNIKVYYIPWNIRTQGALTADDIRNFNDGQNYYYEISTDSVIKNFDRAINIYSFNGAHTNGLIDVRMVIDFILSSNSVFTIELGKNREMKIENSYYSASRELMKVIDKYIPVKTELNKK